MRSFGELLTEYAARAGIGDSELARRIQVNRLTLIRWKEGVTVRPRYREDILRCAEVLRLADDERDLLLAAGGFAPEAPPVPGEAEDAGARPGAANPTPRRAFALRRRTALVIAAAAIAVAGGAAAVALAVARDAETPPPAAETTGSLVALAPFVNYTSGDQGYNVRGRIKDALDAEIREAGLADARTMEWPDEIGSEAEAEDAARRSGAEIVIWGEYDSGRVIARFTAPREQAGAREGRMVDIASSPASLPVTINADFPSEARYVALVTLGRIYLERGEHDLAKAALIQAATRPPSEPDALANLRFLMGRAYRGGGLADFDEAIWLFTQAIAARPTLMEAYLNRGLSYLDRGREGDADQAVLDLTQALAFDRESAAAYRSRAAAYIERGAPGDAERADADLAEAERLDPNADG